ncbi:hypothetical protein QYE76_060630 [Lolium multiflorum]|uniref:DUF4378 domain-containing protein n=1 Tax=Lolium multiflorum TaxID=4521 RepID=A0AAD8S1N3_LOLMU|nr:uncharacterized protein LOC127292142 [Lolium perenne]KAK1642825.1 hypothetical protein QYE76_060630 [Lolium multiflorum]
MGGPSASGRRCRWTQRSRAAGDAAVRRTVSAPTPAPEEAASTAPTRRTAGFAHVDKQQRVGADSGSTSGSKLKEDNLYRGLCEFKHKRSNGTDSFSHQLATSAGRPECTKMGPLSAKRSLSGKMSQLRPLRHGHSNKNQNYIGAANQRYKVTRSGGAVNTLRKEDIHKQSDSSSEGRHWQTLLDNALLRRMSQTANEESSEQPWSCTNSESDKAVCLSSSGSMDDFHVCFPSDTSDTSDSSKFSSLGRVANDQWRMSFKKVHCPLAARINAMSVVPCKEIEHPSPVSVLQPLSEDFSDAETIKQCRDHHDPQPRPELVNLPWVGTVTDVLGLGEINNYLCSEMEDSENDETTELVEDILVEFGDEEERDFSYLLDLLISSGIHGVREDELYKVCQSLDCPAGYDVFDKLEKKYIKVPQWSRSDRKLTFDMVNTILSEILAPCLDMHPWVNSTRNMAPVWGSEGLLEKLLLLLTQRREALALSLPKPEKQAFNQTWPELADYIDRAGREVEKMIKDDLLEELVLDLMSS